MTKIRLICCFVVSAFISCLNSASAQQGTDQISGYWKKKGESVYIRVANSGASYEAEMIRNDWAPGLVGTTYFQNVVQVEDRNNRWAGDLPSSGSDKAGKVTLRMNRSGELNARLRPGGRSTWLRSEPVEKRY